MPWFKCLDFKANLKHARPKISITTRNVRNVDFCDKRWQIIWTVRTIGSYHIFKWERPERESSTVCEREGEEVYQKVTFRDTAQSLLSFRHCLSLKFQIELGAHYNGLFLGTLNGNFFYLTNIQYLNNPHKPSLPQQLIIRIAPSCTTAAKRSAVFTQSTLMVKVPSMCIVTKPQTEEGGQCFRGDWMVAWILTWVGQTTKKASVISLMESFGSD